MWSCKLNVSTSFGFLLLSICAVFGVENNFVYKELIQNFDHTKTQVSVREVMVPTLAALDYAAYHNSPLRYKPASPKFISPANKLTLNDLDFNSHLDSICEALNSTPLTPEERQHPMAWAALKNRIWENLPWKKLSESLSIIESYKWKDSSVFQQYQEVSDLYLHKGKQGYEIWINLEIAPWASFLPGKDDDKNGIREVYARVQKIPEQERIALANWVENSYQKTILDYKAVQEWSQVLASYWYPTLNTDLEPVNDREYWPTKTVHSEIKKQSGYLKLQVPDVIIRGNPLGKVIYQIIDIPSLSRPHEDVGANIKAAPKKADRSLPQNFAQNMDRISTELDSHGGDWQVWNNHLQSTHLALQRTIKKFPEEQKAFSAIDDWLFFKGSLEYSLAGDLSLQDKAHNAIEHLIPFKTWLEDNEINFIFIPIPPKNEIYPEKLVDSKHLPKDQITNPWGRKFIIDAQEEGIEIIDVLPALLNAKKEDAKSSEPLYQKDDTHWTSRGMMVVAKLISQRIQEYSWFGELAPDRNKYSHKDTTFKRLGDLVDRLPVSIQGNYTPATLQGQRVLFKGNPRKGGKESPILLMGDSFTGVYELVDCKNAGVGSQISFLTGIETDIITSWGGGPNVRQKMYSARSKQLGPKRLVIYMMAARDLYHYSQTWMPQSYE